MKNLIITSDLITSIAKATKLLFVYDADVEGEVCYATDPNLRSEFKATFTKEDVENYILGLGPSQNFITPKDAATFWEIVDTGNPHK